MYSGKKEGLTFEKFDDMVISWGREKYGDKYANALWKNELLTLGSLDLTDDLDRYGFETYCEWIFDILSLDSPKYAAELWRSERFWTKKWQLEQRQRQREKNVLLLGEDH
jgi:phage terminase small subunit